MDSNDKEESSEDMNEQSDEEKSTIEKLLDYIDINKDGKIDKKDLDINRDGKFDWKDISWFLVGLMAIIFNLIVDYFQRSLQTSNWKPDGELDFIGYIASAIIILWFTKQKFILMDEEIKKRDKKIQNLIEEKSNLKLEQSDNRSEHKLKEQELKAANRTKKEFIDLIWPFIDEKIKNKITRID